MPRLLGGIIVQAKKFCGVWATTLSSFTCDNTLIACWSVGGRETPEQNI